MDELDGYVARILDMQVADLASPPPSAPAVPQMLHAAGGQRRRWAPLTAVAASLLLAGVLMSDLRTGGEGRSPRRGGVEPLSRAAAFVDEPRAAIGPLAPLHREPNVTSRRGPQARAANDAHQAVALATTAGARGSDAHPRSLRTARAAPAHSHERLRSPAQTSPTGMIEDQAPRTVRVMDTAVDDRLDAVDAIRLLRQR